VLKLYFILVAAWICELITSAIEAEYGSTETCWYRYRSVDYAGTGTGQQRPAGTGTELLIMLEQVQVNRDLLVQVHSC
jgi:hypothetical protein